MNEAARPRLIRVIGRWSLTALMVNGIIGSGIFGLLAAAVGSASPWAALLAGAAMAVMAACYAEVASQFTATGAGPTCTSGRPWAAWPDCKSAG